MGRRKAHFIYLSYVLLWAILSGGYIGAAALSKSANYQLEETSVGGTGLVSAQSTNYQARESGAIIGVGTSTGTNYQVQAGHLTTDSPALSIGIIGSSPSFGSFSPTTTATATSQFDVIDYTSYGYIVQIEGTPPTYGGHQITPLATNSAPQIGVEQFGINLVANTDPISFGANPNFGQFGFGNVATNYDTPNSYRYVNGDEIAYSGKSSGETIYTISYIVDVSDLTPGGQYVSDQNIVCTATY